MDMKRILQALDNASTRPVEGITNMSKFLRIVKEADINPQQGAQGSTPSPTSPPPTGNPTGPQGATPNPGSAPAAPDAGSVPQVDPANYKVPSVEFLKKNYQHPADVIDGAFPSETDPTRIGAWQGGSDFADLMMALDGSYFQARQADPNYQQPGFVKDDWELVQRMLGTPEGKEYAIANWIGLSNVNDKSPEAEFNRAQHKEFEKQANAKMAQQPDGIYTPGWKYDQKLGMTPAQAELQKQKQAQQTAQTGQPQQPALKEDILRLAGILKEGTTPHKVALPVQMAMQHYQKPITEKRVLKTAIEKYFKEAEEDILKKKEYRRQLINQYASVIAERVLTKEERMSAAVKLQRAMERERQKSDASKRRGDEVMAKAKSDWEKQQAEKKGVAEEYNDTVDPVADFLARGGQIKHGKTHKPRKAEKWQGSAHIGAAGGKGTKGTVSGMGANTNKSGKPVVSVEDASSAVQHTANSLLNPPKIMQHRAKRDQERDITYQNAQRGKTGSDSSKYIDLLNKENYVQGHSAGFKPGAGPGIQNNQPIEELVLQKIKPAIPKPIKAKTKTSSCRTGQVQTGVQTKDGKLVPKCSIK
jgi:hypothetical protein